MIIKIDHVLDSDVDAKIRALRASRSYKYQSAAYSMLRNFINDLPFSVHGDRSITLRPSIDKIAFNIWLEDDDVPYDWLTTQPETGISGMNYLYRKEIKSKIGEVEIVMVINYYVNIPDEDLALYQMLGKIQSFVTETKSYESVMCTL